MQIECSENQLTFTGILDENCKLENFLEAFESIKENLTPPLKVDLSNVKRSNSTGIVLWLKFMKNIETPLQYNNCPVWLVNQFNMINQFFSFESKVESFYAPYYSEANDTTRIVKLIVGKDIKVQEDYSDFKAENRIIDGEEYEADYNPSRYFSFLKSSN